MSVLACTASYALSWLFNYADKIWLWHRRLENFKILGKLIRNNFFHQTSGIQDSDVVVPKVDLRESLPQSSRVLELVKGQMVFAEIRLCVVDERLARIFAVGEQQAAAADENVGASGFRLQCAPHTYGFACDGGKRERSCLETGIGDFCSNDLRKSIFSHMFEYFRTVAFH